VLCTTNRWCKKIWSSICTSSSHIITSKRSISVFVQYESRAVWGKMDKKSLLPELRWNERWKCTCLSQCTNWEAWCKHQWIAQHFYVEPFCKPSRPHKWPQVNESFLLGTHTHVCYSRSISCSRFFNFEMSWNWQFLTKFASLQTLLYDKILMHWKDKLVSMW
jgi:hypothetical protein